tara:strand:- start:705 stop:947 length:243 start_codon:yes stop_codon:yes gene_type:complete
MFIEQEKQLINKNFQDREDRKSLLSFFYKKDPQCQVNITKVNSQYKVSFPMSNYSIHYATYFNEKKEAKEYLDFIIKSHL